jgi:hypothetical protein
LTVNTQVVKPFLREIDMPYIPLNNGLRVQVLPNITYLPECQKHHFAAFIQNPPILVVWDDDPNHLLTRAQGIEDHLMSLIWNLGEEENEKINIAVPNKAASLTAGIYVKEIFSPQNSNSDEILAEPPRKIVLIQPVLTAVTLILMLAAIGSGWRYIAMELMVDHNWIRLAFLVVVPLQIWLALVNPASVICLLSKLTASVLHASSCRLHSADNRSHQPDD